MQCKRQLVSALAALMHTWESYQVELQGHYSVERLQELAHYSATHSWLRAIAANLFTVIPPILAIVLADILPLNPPTGGLHGQNAAYFVRLFYTVSIMSVASIIQFHHSSTRLPLKLWWAATATLFITSCTVGLMVILHATVGFPTPFVYQFTSGFWMVCLALSLWTMWKPVLRKDAEARADLKRFVLFLFAQVAMIIVYPVCGYVFRTLNNQQQTLFSMVLPIWKLALKIWTSYSVFRVEDKAPVYVVFTVDVFHALFLTAAMQSSTSTGYGTLLVVVAVDFFQSGVAIVEVRGVVGRLQRLAESINQLEINSDGVQQTSAMMRKTAHPLCRAALDYAADILASSPQIRGHPEIACARHQRRSSQLLGPQQSQLEYPDDQNTERVLADPQRKNTAKVFVASAGNKPPEADSVAPGKLTELVQLRVRYVRGTMKLLHMVEFYMLVEFTEVVIAIVYCTFHELLGMNQLDYDEQIDLTNTSVKTTALYLLVMPYLPNRVYYAQLQSMTNTQWESTVTYVFKYALYELFSYVLLVLLLRHSLHMSPLKQVAFTLEKHFALVQSLLVLWVFFVIQMSLDHLGSDYSFKFAWLNKPPTAS